MTEKQWLKDVDTERWLYPDKTQEVSERKLRLFCAACCRRIWHLLPEACRLSVQTAEEYADGRVNSDVLHRENSVANELFSNISDDKVREAVGAVCYSTGADIRGDASLVTVCAYRAASNKKGEREAEEAAQADLLREVFENPFRPVTFAPSWLTPTVVALAAGIYADRAFDRLPILADALQEAGCESEQVLAHCRSDGPHVRGCWVVDGVLGKE